MGKRTISFSSGELQYWQTKREVPILVWKLVYEVKGMIVTEIIKKVGDKHTLIRVSLGVS